MKNIDVLELNSIIQGSPATVVIDVRSHDEYILQHIPQAKNVPLDFILSDPERAITQINDLVPSTQETIYVVCLSDRRSFMACHQLNEAGLSNTCYIKGGTHGWVQAHLPVNSGV